MGRNLSILLAIAVVSIQGCDQSDPPNPCAITYDILNDLGIEEVNHPNPVVEGSRFSIRGESFVGVEHSCVSHDVVLVGGVGGSTTELVIDSEIISINEIQATLPPNSIEPLGGPGTFSGTLEVRFASNEQTITFTSGRTLTFELRQSLTPEVTGLDQNDVYLNDEVRIEGSGFLDAEIEGTTHVLIEGLYTNLESEITEVSDIVLSASPFGSDRSQATFLWSPRIGGLEPGSFTGTITPRNTHADGTTTTGDSLSINLEQQRSVLFNLSSDEVSIGQYVEFNGRGFIGADGDEPTEDHGATSFRLLGEFAPCSGVPPECSKVPTKVDLEVVGSWQSGSLVRYAITVSNTGGRVHAVDFQADRGIFEGSITPILTFGSQRFEGLSIPGTSITLGPIRQVAWVRFLPGFSDSLDLFGLGAVERYIQSRVIERMQEIFCPPDQPNHCVNVDFRADEPQDFYPGAYAIVDIGGPDPYDLGLFGYDNTPGKDIGNLRLWDHVGGHNALGEEDGFGYGGVFVESMLYWSEHPPFDGRPMGAPPADPQFDDVFDALRYNEVVAGEYPNGASADRIADIEAGISFLANMIADTAAHEFGHSLGLAQPQIPDDEYHNIFPQSGCLMDAGRDRPLEERAMLDGNPGARFCQENFTYLQEILPME